MQKGKVKLGKHVGIALCQLAGGIIVAVVFLFIWLGSVIIRAGSPSLIFLSGALWLFILCLRGGHTLLLADRCNKINKILNKNGGRISIDKLADEHNKPVEKVLEDLGALVGRDFLGNIQVDTDRYELVVKGVPPKTEKPDSENVLQKSNKRSYFPVYPAIAVLITYYGFNSAGGVVSLLIGAVLAVVVFVGLLKLLPKEYSYRVATRPVPVTGPASTGSPELDTIINTAVDSLADLTKLSRQIAGTKVEEQLQELLNISSEIISHIKEFPEKGRQLRQFFNYYLPTTQHLIQEYVNFQHQQVKPENMVRSMGKIEELMQSTVDIFKRELNNLYLDKAVDISAEVDVFQGMLQREGLGAPDINKQL